MAESLGPYERFIIARDWAVLRQLNSRTTHVLKELTMRANNPRYECYVREATLRECCRIKELSMLRAMNQLKRYGIIRLVGRTPVEKYQVDVPKMQQELGVTKVGVEGDGYS